MPDVRETRRRFSLALTVLLVIDVAAACVLISPIGKGARSGQQQLDQLWSELSAKQRESIPLKGIDQKVVDAKEEIGSFYKNRLPDSFSEVSEELGKQAASSNVKISTGKYETAPADVPGLTRVNIDVAITGDYVQAMKFINQLERDKLFFLIDTVTVGEVQAPGGAQGPGGLVRLQVRLETYVRSA